MSRSLRPVAASPEPSGPKTLVASLRRPDHGGMTAEPRQCPFCELRFEYHNEVKDHIVRDHPEHPTVGVTSEIHELPHA